MPTVHEMGSKELVAALGLVPHPEGGFFLETWRSGCAPMSTMGQTDCDAEVGVLLACRVCYTRVYTLLTCA